MSSMVRRLLLVLVAACSFSLGSSEEVNPGDAQIEWLKSRGGNFHPKLSIRSVGSPPRLAVFASDDIAKGEDLITIPPNCFIDTKGEGDLCSATRILLKEVKLGQESEFAPYLTYLSSMYHWRLSSSWSQEAMDLFQIIVGRELDGPGEVESHFQEDCGGTGDSLEEDTYLLLSLLSWGGKMVPLLDMIDRANGRWHNVDINDKGSFTFTASRDIASGEQLQYSWQDTPFEWSAKFKDYGFVELYPQHWTIGKSEFVLNTTTSTDDLTLTWMSHKPKPFQIQFLRGHLERLKGLHETVSEKATQLKSSHEKEVVMAYYQSLMSALDEAIWSAMETGDNGHEETCEISADGEQTCTQSPRQYDSLEHRPDPLSYDTNRCDWHEDGEYVDATHVESFYQKIDFDYNEELGDSCLYLNSWLQACASLRPHYHEVFVHYPARFVPEVKRVIFIGGGDLMILHEILKYPSLELVVGLELDQQVARSSFKNFGTQPHWHNEKVEWWYGDATKTLHMLPKEYYGSFDLVLIDLQTAIADILKVTDELRITDAVTLLGKPDSVFAKNEDFVGMPRDFADYTVDLNYHDVPVFCEQSITLGSNSQDFLTKELVDHKIETLFLPPVDEKVDHFEGWYNYGKDDTRANKHCKDPEGKEEELVDQTRSLGVVMILEAENTTTPLASIQATLSDAIKKAGLNQISTHIHAVNQDGENRDLMVFISKEGYVVARTWPDHQYCSFDVMLWSSFQKLGDVQKELLAAVGSQIGKTSSSYRLVTGGMFGVSTWKEDQRNTGPRATELCEKPDETVRDTPVEQTAMSTVLGESVSLIQGQNEVVLVLCGENSRPCASQEELTKMKAINKVIPMWACPGVGTDEKDADAASERMFDCETKIQNSLAESIGEGGKIGGIVIDPEAPREMGQILHKLFSNVTFRKELVADGFVVLDITPRLSGTWRRELLERFRTDFVKFDPAYKADVFFNSTTSTLELGVFSTGDTSFYSNLVDVLSSIEKKTGLVADLRNVKNGILNYVADFHATKRFAIDSYDNSSPLEQWLSQMPLGRQTIFQFEAKASPEPSITCPLVFTSLQDALREVDFYVYAEDESRGPYIQSTDLSGDVAGCFVFTFSDRGNAVAVWDGREHVDVNLFTFSQSKKTSRGFEKHFIEKIPSLSTTARDQQPRGFGRVINFEKEIGDRDEAPRWVKDDFFTLVTGKPARRSDVGK